MEEKEELSINEKNTSQKKKNELPKDEKELYLHHINVLLDTYEKDINEYRKIIDDKNKNDNIIEQKSLIIGFLIGILLSTFIACNKFELIIKKIDSLSHNKISVNYNKDDKGK